MANATKQTDRNKVKIETDTKTGVELEKSILQRL